MPEFIPQWAGLDYWLAVYFTNPQDLRLDLEAEHRNLIEEARA